MRSRRVFSALNAFLLPAGQLTPVFAGDWNIALRSTPRAAGKPLHRERRLMFQTMPR